MVDMTAEETRKYQDELLGKYDPLKDVFKEIKRELKRAPYSNSLYYIGDLSEEDKIKLEEKGYTLHPTKNAFDGIIMNTEISWR